MSKFKLQVSQIDVGVPLPFDTFDASGKLLLRQGFRIESAEQLERLLERGLYSEQPPERTLGSWPLRKGAAAVPTTRKVAVFDLIVDAQSQLESILAQPQAHEFETRIHALAKLLQHAFSLDSDAALAYIQLFHGGRYSVRRMVHGAIPWVAIAHALNAQWGVVTISLGVCWQEVASGELKRIFRQADGKLYEAKNNGRNRVEFAAQ